MTSPAPLWRPTPAWIEGATLTRYTGWAEERLGRPFPDYEALWRWSVDDLDGFWASLWEFFDVRASRGYDAVLGRREMPGAEWFPGAELSYAEHVFRGKADDAVALVHASELRPLAETTWGELRATTAEIAGGLLELGVSRGDRVVAYLPNVAEATAAFLACASIGAIWSSCSPDFGAGSAVDRFAQIEPTVLLAVDGYRYGGRDFDRLETVAALRQALPSLRHTVVLPYLGTSTASWPDGALGWDELLARGAGGPSTFAQLPFDHPLWVLYSSGTTGLPKAIVHGQGGILLEHLKQAHLHLDARLADRVFWFTTTGWMMWNLLLGVLLTESAIVLYDGSPAHPDPDVLWQLADDAGITCFGTSAAYLTSCAKAGVEPRRGRRLTALRSVGSTGSPLPPEGFRWVADHVGEDVWLFSTSGGTDLCTAFVGGVPTLPVVEGELQARALGAKVEAFDPAGESLVGAVGELVLTEPMPSMPLRFWGDPDGSRYRESYFDVYPGVWRHGDWIEITERGTALITGRSDATINRGGVRMGTSELYRAVLSLDVVVDALAVDVTRGGADRLLLFVVLRDGALLDAGTIAAIRTAVRERCSPRHVPDEVQQVAEVPRTLSGKVLELPVKRILMGASPESVASRDSLANPAALDAFVALARTLSFGAAASDV